MWRIRCVQGEEIETFRSAFAFPPYVSRLFFTLCPFVLVFGYLFNLHPRSTIPRVWIAHSYPSNTPLGPYITDLVKRLNMFSTWIVNGAPVVAWLPGFFFTQSFLTAVLQNFARKYKLPVDSLKFSYNILPDPPSTKPEDGCCIDGLYLDGGRWNPNHQCIADPQPKVIILSQFTRWFMYQHAY